MLEYTHCPFCKEFEKGFFSLEGKNYGNRILYETENFVVIPALSPMVDGYLLIVSKVHLLGIGQIPTKMHQELEEICSKVRLVLSDVYAIEPIFFEHGAISKESITSKGKGVCCIDHSHLHVVPVSGIHILEELQRKFISHKCRSFKALSECFDRELPYIYFENNDGIRHIFEISNDIPSQYIRRIIARDVCKHDKWNWRVHFDIDIMLETKEKLKSYFLHKNK